ncbi:MAG: Leucine-rich repeat (LRR) protein [Halioglobus sp.]|jgi:Leucine-rich repeat (LRR) protein
MFIKSNVYALAGSDSITTKDQFFKGFFDSFLGSFHASLMDVVQVTEEEISKFTLGESFRSFRKTVWKQKFTRCNREELCEIALPQYWDESADKELLQDWREELVTAWESMLGRFPTFIIYFSGGTSFTTESMRAFTKALRKLEEKEIQNGDLPQISLFLADNGIDDEGACLLSEAFMNCETLIHLDMKNNSITSTGALALSKLVENSHSLKVLDLSGNPIGEEGSIAFAEALRPNISLKSLSLSTENISIPAAKAFEISRACNHTLELLDIWR